MISAPYDRTAAILGCDEFDGCANVSGARGSTLLRTHHHDETGHAALLGRERERASMVACRARQLAFSAPATYWPRGRQEVRRRTAVHSGGVLT